MTVVRLWGTRSCPGEFRLASGLICGGSANGMDRPDGGASLKND